MSTSSLSSEATPRTQSNVIVDLRTRIEDTLRDLITPEGPFALLDFPHYDNIGDSAIYLGEIAYLQKRGLQPAYISTIDGFNSTIMDAHIKDGPIYLQGGGNFGDIWPWFQDFRETIMERYQGRPIVQMPQTLHFISQERVDQTARAIEKHGNYKLLVRDHRSYDFAKKSFQCEIRLCPDMAFCIPPVKPPLPEKELLIHLRNDREANAAYDTKELASIPSVVHSDWPKERIRYKPFLHTKIWKDTLFSGKASMNLVSMRHAFYQQIATHRFNRGTELLGKARTVITDRLHGHIMCVLMGIPHCVLDNSYGKTSSFMEAWGTKCDHTYTASTLEEAVETLKKYENVRLDKRGSQAGA